MFLIKNLFSGQPDSWGKMAGRIAPAFSWFKQIYCCFVNPIDGSYRNHRNYPQKHLACKPLPYYRKGSVKIRGNIHASYFLLPLIVSISFLIISGCSRQENQENGIISQIWHGETASAQHSEPAEDQHSQHQLPKTNQVSPQSKGNETLETIKSKMKTLIKGKTVPIKNSEQADGRPDDHSGHNGQNGRSGQTNRIMVSPDRQQLVGVKTEVARRQSLDKTIRTVGKVGYDESKISYVNLKFSGYIEELFVNYTGTLVKKGDPLFRVYSPELVATHEEHLLALKAKNYFESSPFKEIAAGGNSLLEAARQRLRLWDISDEEIAQIEQNGKPLKYITISAPVGGIVIEKMAVKGLSFNAGEALYKIADLNSVWVQADVYEYELPLVQVGQTAFIKLTYLPGQNFIGKVSYIYPYLDPQTRTARVRFEVANHSGKLKPEMFADVEFRANLSKVLAIPNEAILDSGVRQMVFLDRGNGYFEPREVKLGQKLDGHQVVLAGIKEGDRIVTSANFLIDSESSLKAAMAGMKH